jgi:hypothetical protein
MTGRRVTLDELFAERAEELRRFAESPEGKAQAVRNHEKFQREEKARLEWEAANPRTPFELGSEAAENGDERNPPEELEGAAVLEWFAGYDEASEDDED